MALARILAVDDSEQNLTMIELYLRGGEFEVVTAKGGREALDLAHKQHFDLILLDVVMPGIDGFEVCRRLKANPQTAFVPVIFLTGRMTGESERLQAFQIGAVDYMHKPVNKDELVARIRVMLVLADTRSRLERENAGLQTELRHALTRWREAELRDGELLALSEAWGSEAKEGILLLDSQFRILGADAAVRELLGPLRPGEFLRTGGHGAARLQRMLQEGARSAELSLPVGERVVTVIVQCREARPAEILTVSLRDVSAIRSIEARLRSREPAAQPEFRRPAEVDYTMGGFIGRSAKVREVAAMVDRLRQGRSTVLIHGESGTGKELVARALHFDGAQGKTPFIPIHCGAISPELIESELFGYEKGAFTGALTSHEGLFSVADGGTIFLDEIAETSPDLQVKLLRVLQMGEIRPVGANMPRIVDVRIIAATNKQLPQLVREGRLREDLYYRLGVVTMMLPSLRERLEDVPALVTHFLARFNRRHGREANPVTGVSGGAMSRLLAYPWPGNVRELENVIDRAFALGCGKIIQEEDLPVHVLEGQSELHPDRPPADLRAAAPGAVALDLRARRQAIERDAILHALERCRGDKAEAARLLGVARSTFYRRLKELRL